MNWMSTLLALYLTALSVWPCHDESVVVPAGRVAVSAQTDEPVGHTGHNHLCSPFCSCACCGAHLNVPPILTFVPEPEGWHLLPASLFSYASSAWFAPPATIWQPPQLG